MNKNMLIIDKQIKRFYSLLFMCLIVLTLFIIKSPLFITERFIAIIFVLYLNIVCYLSTKETKFTELLGLFDSTENCKSYLNSVIDILKIADKEIKKANVIGDLSDYRVQDSVNIINGCIKRLNNLNPPKKYIKKHNNILLDLELFLQEYSLVY